MNTKRKLYLLMLSLFALVSIVAWNAHSPLSDASQLQALDPPTNSMMMDSQYRQASVPEIQVTVPPLPIETPPPESTSQPGSGGGGGMSTIFIGMLVVVALVAFVGLLLWIASRGGRGY